MLESLKVILAVQELDMKMIRLMRLKKERQKELTNIHSIRNDLEKQLVIKEGEIIEVKKNIRIGEMEVQEAGERITKLEKQQNSVKKVDEFNALSAEISAAERDKALKEQRVSDLLDKLTAVEDVHKELIATRDSTKQSSELLEKEIAESIAMINREGMELKAERDEMVSSADPEAFRVYERLLKNKKDRVVVPIENRTCSGCHIVLTAQHENLVRKGERLVFCEHCSRIHYWQESEQLEGSSVATKRRRRRAAKTT